MVMEMNELEVNEYINKAEQALKDNPEYQHWFAALARERQRLLSLDITIDKIEGILFELWHMKIEYILDHTKAEPTAASKG